MEAHTHNIENRKIRKGPSSVLLDPVVAIAVAYATMTAGPQPIVHVDISITIKANVGALVTRIVDDALGYDARRSSVDARRASHESG